jgi:predicted Zn-dependent protease
MAFKTVRAFWRKHNLRNPLSIAWRAVWWMPMLVAMFVFLGLHLLLTLSPEETKDLYDNMR